MTRADLADSTADALSAVRDARIARTLAAVAAAHPFYRKRFRDCGVDLAKVRTLDDLARLPLTAKADFAAAPEEFRLDPDALPPDTPMEERVLWDVAYTTGSTTGRPSPFYNTTHDIDAVMDQARRCNEAEGLRPDDRVANLYPVAGFPTGAFLSVVRSTMIAGMPVVHGLTGASRSEFKVRNSVREAVARVARFRPTVLWGVPSFVRRFLDEATREGATLADVRMVLTSGEPVSAALRGDLRDVLAQLGAPSVTFRARYAFTEMQGGLVQCAEKADAQNVCPDLYFFEVVDPDSGRRLPDGETGALAITHLHRRGTVLLRYLMGDLVALSRAPCPHCGRVGERSVTTPRRFGALVKCRGMLVNTDLVLDVLSSLEGIGEYQVVFSRDDHAGAMDALVLRIELDEAAGAPRGAGPRPWSAQALREHVTTRVRDAVSLRPEVVFVPRGSLYDHEQSIKAKRVVDLRPRAD